MSTFAHLWTWQQAAYREALRARAPEVDLEHLLLGLLAQGGAAAELLGAQGVSLASAREAIGRVQAEHLARFGVDVSGLATAPLPLADVNSGTGDVPFGKRALALLDGPKTQRRDTLTSLRTLLAEPSGTARRVLAAAGADPDALAAAAAGAETPARLWTTADPRPGILPGEARALRTRSFVSASPAELAAVAADPEAAPAWFAPGPEVRVRDGGLDATAKSRRGVQVSRWDVSVEDTVPTVVRWVESVAEVHSASPRIERSARRWIGAPIGYVEVALEAVPGGTRVTTTRAFRIFGRLGRLLGGVLNRLNGVALPQLTQGLAQAVAER